MGDGWVGPGRWVYEWMDALMEGWMDGWIHGDGWTEGWMDGRTHMDGWTRYDKPLGDLGVCARGAACFLASNA